MIRISLGATLLALSIWGTLACTRHNLPPSNASRGEIALKGSLGSDRQPSDSEAIAPIPSVDTLFEFAGPAVGDTISDLTLYTPSGTPVNFKSELRKGKPLMFVTGSYTCAAFRGSMRELNMLCSQHVNDLTAFIVYVVEAHPSEAVSPYVGLREPPMANVADGTFCKQAKTYGQRREQAADMLRKAPILPSVLVDGPENKFWLNFGHAPNGVYIVDTRGRVAYKGTWYNRLADHVGRAVDTILKSTSIANARNNAM